MHGLSQLEDLRGGCEGPTTEAIVEDYLWQMIEVTSQERACAVAFYADRFSSDPVASRETCQLE
jgi:hypothetical protein